MGASNRPCGPDGQFLGKEKAEQMPRNTSTLADMGGYTCTYDGCSLYFKTLEKMKGQRHEAHRWVVTRRRGLHSALPAHKSVASLQCKHTNAKTGKPYNVLFT